MPNYTSHLTIVDGQLTSGKPIIKEGKALTRKNTKHLGNYQLSI